MKLNNKGQSLVMFVLLIPLFLLILAMVVDIGNLINTKVELNSVNKLVVSSGLDDINNDNLEDELKILLIKNYGDIDSYEINVNSNRITIVLEDYSKSIFGNIIGNDGYKVESKYIGYIDNDKKKIEKVK